MTRKFSFPALALALVCSFGIVGCGGSGGEATFDPSEVEAQSADEVAEAEAYKEEMEGYAERMKEEYGN